VFARPTAGRAELEEVARLIDSGAVRPVVGAEFSLADALLAYRHKPARGKVVLRVGDTGRSRQWVRQTGDTRPEGSEPVILGSGQTGKCATGGEGGLTRPAANSPPADSLNNEVFLLG
jgi:hypothetical protein